MDAILTVWLPMIAAVGVVAMELIEILKVRTSLRMRFNGWMLAAWFERCGIPVDVGERLLGHGSEDVDALKTLPAPELAAQLRKGARLAMAFPDQKANRRLVAALAGESLAVPEPLLARLRELASGAQPPDDADGETLLAARSVVLAIERRLDTFAVDLERKWRRAMQDLASVFSGLIFLVVLLAIPLTGSEGVAVQWFWALPLAVLGGIVAPASRDLLDALQRLRTRDDS